MSTSRSWITIWAVVSSIIVLWDAGYCFSRPRSFHGGDLNWIWKPYSLYQNIDLVYGVEAHRRGDGFTNAQALLNVFEVTGNLFYVYKAEVAKDPAAPLIALCTAIATFWKTALYWIQEYYCGGCAVGHNDMWTLFWLWIIPNGVWLIVPAAVIWVLYPEVSKSLSVTGVPGRSAAVGRKSNGKSQ